MTSSLPLIDHAAWLKETTRGILASRNKELEAIDRHIKGYEKAKREYDKAAPEKRSEYGKNWELNELRIALDSYKKAKPDWKTSERNKTKAFEKLDASLVLLRFEYPKQSTPDHAMATNVRQGTLFFLSRLRVDSGESPNWSAFIDESLDNASDVHAAVATVRSLGVKQTATVTGAFVKSGAKGPEASDSFMKPLITGLSDFLRKLAGNDLGPMAQQALKAVLDSLPSLLLKILGSIAQHLGAAVSITGNFIKVATSAVALFSTRDLERGVLDGHPRGVIVAVRGQIEKRMKTAGKEALETTLLTGVSIANPIVGSVASAVVAIYKFVGNIWQRIKEDSKLVEVVTQARVHYANKLYNDQKDFQKWFLGVIKDMPLLACYCMRMPLTGGYYGFLTIVSTDGSQISYEQLERNFGMFNDVKEWAGKFIKENKLQLKVHAMPGINSDHKMLEASIRVAEGESVSEVKSTLGDRMEKVVFSLVETAAG